MFPESACAYEIYDPITLEPSNESTYIRLMELGWKEDDFHGKTVLDIGANSGALSIYANKLGAKSVHSTDVQKPLVDFMRSVYERHHLPITVEKTGFWDLKPNSHAADIVLFMEVLHWIVDQGGSVEDAIEHIAALTKETLYFETPWDINEPSIARKGIIPADKYNIEIIIKSLSKHFSEVRIVRFMTYFGNMPNSKRVYIVAKGRRPASLPLSKLPNCHPLGMSIDRGQNPLELLSSPDGPMVLKELPSHSPMLKLHPNLVNSFYDGLHQSKATALVLPIKIGNHYIYRAADGRSYMLFPFVGRLGDHFPKKLAPQGVDSPIRLALALGRQLSAVPRAVVDALRDASNAIPAPKLEHLPKEIVEAISRMELGAFVSQIGAAIENYDRAREDTIVHSDLQYGNMMRLADGSDAVVDLDLFRTGTAYSDIVSCIIYNGVDVTSASAALDQAHREMGRRMTEFDIYFGAAQALGWCAAISKQQGRPSERGLEWFLRGLQTAAVLRPS